MMGRHSLSTPFLRSRADEAMSQSPIIGAYIVDETHDEVDWVKNWRFLSMREARRWSLVAYHSMVDVFGASTCRNEVYVFYVDEGVFYVFPGDAAVKVLDCCCYLR